MSTYLYKILIDGKTDLDLWTIVELCHSKCPNNYDVIAMNDFVMEQYLYHYPVYDDGVGKISTLLMYLYFV